MGVHFAAADILFALLGGLLIGGASVLNLFLAGRITGISGMCFSMLPAGAACSPADRFSKFSFLTGMVATGYLLYLTVGSDELVGGYRMFDPFPSSINDLSLVGFALAGILVGAGTKLGNGCTSGHGICGLARLSPRSLVAVCSFMATGFGIATLRHYAPFLSTPVSWDDTALDVYRIILDAVVLFLLLVWVLFAAARFVREHSLGKQYDPIISLVTGAMFGAGLSLSGMARRSKVTGFLTIADQWDPSLAFVMGGGLMLTLPLFQTILRVRSQPVFTDISQSFCVPNNNKIDLQLVIGAALFGLGWGLGGLCPGPALINGAILGNVMLFLVCMAIGQMAAHYYIVWDASRTKQGKGETQMLCPSALEDGADKPLNAQRDVTDECCVREVQETEGDSQRRWVA